MSLRGTTIVAVRKGKETAIAGDGQVTLGESITMKGNAVKVRRLYGGSVLCGFAGSTADAFTLEERFEGKLKEFDDLTRAAVELAKEWRLDKALRQLDAMLLTADKHRILLISGKGDVIEPEYDVVGIGSGGAYAFAAARAFMESKAGFGAEEIARKSLMIAADICVFTNGNIVAEVLKQ